jgi:hypothetical protein
MLLLHHWNQHCQRSLVMFHILQNKVLNDNATATTTIIIIIMIIISFFFLIILIIHYNKKSKVIP